MGIVRLSTLERRAAVIAAVSGKPLKEILTALTFSHLMREIYVLPDTKRD